VSAAAGRDLVVVVPDDPIRLAVEGVLRRREALGTRAIRADFRLEPGRDPGCYSRAHKLIQHEAKRCAHALVVFDRDWQGVPDGPAERLEQEVEERLRPVWGDRARCVVIAPEVEAWVFSTSPHVARVLGWPGQEELRGFLRRRGLWADGDAKPADPKAAMRAALREKQIPPSAALFGELAGKVSLERCVDRSFVRLRDTLKAWFP
jgi:hypothetical protein